MTAIARSHAHAVNENEDGFTLLEMLVSMTLLALLSVALLSAIRSGTQIWRVSEEVAAGSNRIRNAQSLIASEIAAAYPETVATAADNHVDFDGKADGLSFLTADRNLPGALTRVTLSVDDESGNLLLSRTLELSNPTDRDAASQVLLHGVKSLDISYLGQGSDKAAADWEDTWQNRPTPPQLIRIRVAFANPHARPWPELIVAPRIAADVNCTYDPIAKYCQGH
jgi:general secretion pathway protein J